MQIQGKRTAAAIDRYQRAKELVNAGMGMGEACEKVKMSTMSWYKYKKMDGEGALPEVAAQAKRPYNKKPKFIDLAPIVESERGDQVAVVFCKPNQLKDILGGLK